tara:strand:- start:14375 stop:14854 length:480 start_codon:yes stop_codon:yes gene_type:complete
MLSMLSLLQCKEKRGWWTTRPIREECFVKLSDSEALTAAAASPHLRGAGAVASPDLDHFTVFGSDNGSQTSLIHPGDRITFVDDCPAAAMVLREGEVYLHEPLIHKDMVSKAFFIGYFPSEAWSGEIRSVRILRGKELLVLEERDGGRGNWQAVKYTNH